LILSVRSSILCGRHDTVAAHNGSHSRSPAR
jgi:hypothetical protein